MLVVTDKLQRMLTVSTLIFRSVQNWWKLSKDIVELIKLHVKAKILYEYNKIYSKYR